MDFSSQYIWKRNLVRWADNNIHDENLANMANANFILYEFSDRQNRDDYLVEACKLGYSKACYDIIDRLQNQNNIKFYIDLALSTPNELIDICLDQYNFRYSQQNYIPHLKTVGMLIDANKFRPSSDITSITCRRCHGNYNFVSNYYKCPACIEGRELVRRLYLDNV